MKYCLTFLSILLFSFSTMAQVSSDYAVQVSAKVQSSPAQINLHWPKSVYSQGYTIFRKAKTDIYWGSSLASLAGTATGYTDNNVKSGQSYEYKIVSDNSSFTAYGYILAGIEAPAIENRGKLILLVDDTFSIFLQPEIDRLILDMQGDGWAVIRHDVKRNAKVTAIKTLLNNDYKKDKINTKALFLLGHVPVPYSGDFQPDGHPNHRGAWPADTYYGDFTGTWTDYYYNDTVASDKRNWNLPGDGKFDADLIPGVLKLQIGRVDLSDLPSFKATEIVLMKRYLDKDHAFRQKQITAQERAIVDDNFGAFSGEAFAASGYKAFAPMFGDSNVINGDYLDSGMAHTYLFEYGCGGGWFQGAGGIGNTDSFVKDSVKSVFSMLFGSYFGDWGSTDNFLRAPLASKGWTLTNCWSGRPHWIMHAMALGENIGYCAQISESDASIYFRHPQQTYGSLRNSALMGDPTLRLHIIAPPGKLSLSNSSDSVKMKTKVSLHWGASAEKVLGYNIYRTTTLDSPFSRINTSTITDTIYIDTMPKHGTNYYMVRALNLQTSGSGTYYNMSQGMMSNSTYSFTLGVETANAESSFFKLYPNPSNGNFYIEFNNDATSKSSISITDALGREVFKKENLHSNKMEVNLDNYSSGVYFVSIRNAQGISVQKMIVKQ